MYLFGARSQCRVFAVTRGILKLFAQMHQFDVDLYAITLMLKSVQESFEDELTVTASADLSFAAPKPRIAGSLERGNKLLSGALVHQERRDAYTSCTDTFSKLNIYCSAGRQVCYIWHVNTNLGIMGRPQTAREYRRSSLHVVANILVVVVAN